MARKVQILPPETRTGIQYISIPNKAAGIKGVTVAMQHLSEELGLMQGLKLMTKINQTQGADCPGCAWPDPKSRSKLFEYCENGAKAVAEEATKKRVDPFFFEKHSVEDMSTWSDYKIGRSGRLTDPMFLAKNATHYTPISWEDAYAKIASKLNEVDPNEAVFYTSGRTANETAFLYQLMVRRLGTNNLPDCSNMCHESSGVGLSTTVGIGKGSVTLEDIYEAEVIMVVGQNPGTNHPRMLSALQKAKKNGAFIAHVNPLPEVGTTKFVDPQSPLDILKGGTKIADQFVQVRVNGDIALFKLLMISLLKAEKEAPGKVLDQKFITNQTKGFEALASSLQEESEDLLLADCGLERSEIEKLSTQLITKDKIIICWAMGVTQHKNGVATVQEIVNLLLMKGSIGRPGAGTCPVRGHSNVQGDRTMGIFEKPPVSLLDSIDQRYSFSSPREHGYDVVDAIRAMNEEKVRFFMAMGGNFVSATPDSQLTGKAMQKVELTVQVSTKLNRSHLVTGEEAIILPCLSRTDRDIQAGKAQFYTVENSMGVVHRSQGTLNPTSNLRSEVAIVCELSNELFGSSADLNWCDWKNDYNLIREEIEAVIPGFDEYNRRVRQPLGFHLPNGARTRNFNTSDGKAHFTVNGLPKVNPTEAEFVLMTIRTHDQYNTTIYGLDDRYRGIKNERRVCLINPSDLEKLGMKKGDLIDFEGVFNGEKRYARGFHLLPYSIPKGCLGSYFPETNVLVPLESFADKSQTPTSKYIEVNLIPHKTHKV